MFLGPLLIRSCAMAILVVNSPYTSQVGSVPSSLVFIKNPTDAVIVNHTSWSMKMKSTPLSSFPEKIFLPTGKPSIKTLRQTPTPSVPTSIPISVPRLVPTFHPSLPPTENPTSLPNVEQATLHIKDSTGPSPSFLTIPPTKTVIAQQIESQFFAQNKTESPTSLLISSLPVFESSGEKNAFLTGLNMKQTSLSYTTYLENEFSLKFSPTKSSFGPQEKSTITKLAKEHLDLYFQKVTKLNSESTFLHIIDLYISQQSFVEHNRRKLLGLSAANKNSTTVVFGAIISSLTTKEKIDSIIAASFEGEYMLEFLQNFAKQNDNALSQIEMIELVTDNVHLIHIVQRVKSDSIIEDNQTVILAVCITAGITTISVVLLLSIRRRRHLLFKPICDVNISDTLDMGNSFDTLPPNMKSPVCIFPKVLRTDSPNFTPPKQCNNTTVQMKDIFEKRNSSELELSQEQNDQLVRFVKKVSNLKEAEDLSIVPGLEYCKKKVNKHSALEAKKTPKEENFMKKEKNHDLKHFPIQPPDRDKSVKRPHFKLLPSKQPPASCYEVKEFVIKAPPGKLGILIDCPVKGGPCVIHGVKEDSPVAYKINRGDAVIKIDNYNVQKCNAVYISKLLSKRATNTCRHITVLRRMAQRKQKSYDNDIPCNDFKEKVKRSEYVHSLSGRENCNCDISYSSCMPSRVTRVNINKTVIAEDELVHGQKKKSPAEQVKGYT
uniref:PDZ domain-containing protein n=2 Tax=Corethron hystrix TaxID=216773 RepID=A0A7S1BS66_9STRA|mmetsp:Transcript_39268/g.91620  ORF Transcript_39268/g.91620 Transcript_39268/m.91620 type:complete len:718 (+) Transcript_39268:460-2613(+)